MAGYMYTISAASEALTYWSPAKYVPLLPRKKTPSAIRTRTRRRGRLRNARRWAGQISSHAHDSTAANRKRHASRVSQSTPAA